MEKNYLRMAIELYEDDLIEDNNNDLNDLEVVEEFELSVTGKQVLSQLQSIVKGDFE